MGLRFETKNPAVTAGFPEAKSMSCRSPASGRFVNSAGLDAIAANGHAFHGTVNLCPHVLQIRHETTRGSIVSVAHMVARHRFLATNFTNSCHLITPSRKFKITFSIYPEKRREARSFYRERMGTSALVARLRKPVFLVNMNKMGLDL